MPGLLKRVGSVAAAGAAAIMLGGCASTLRPETPVAVDTLGYNTAVAEAKQRQLLLNIVRLRYNDPVNFLDIQTLTTEDSTTTAAGLGTALGLDDGPFTEVLGVDGAYERAHTPTMIYGHLRGKEYANRLLKPVPPSSIFLLSQSGWSVERLMLCCIARMGDLENARSAAGPTPSELPDNRDFKALAAKMRFLQQRGDLIVQVVPNEAEEGAAEDVTAAASGPQPTLEIKWTGEGPPPLALATGGEDDPGSRIVIKWRTDESDTARTAQDVAGMLRDNHVAIPTDLAGARYLATLSSRGDAIGDYAVRGRSLLGILSALSQTVNVPAEHAGLVQQTAGGSGASAISPCTPAPPWSDVLDSYFAVQSSKSRPENASIAVPYRGHWFYIDDTCRSAKSTLDLIGHLYALQAGIGGAGESDAIVLLGG